MFETMFDDITKRFVEEEKKSAKEMEKKVEEIELKFGVKNKTKDNDLEIKDDHDHEEHIKVTGIKDVTSSERKNEELNEANKESSNKIKKSENVKSEEASTSTIHPAEVEPTQHTESDHELALSHSDTKTHTGDNILTAREKKKQIKEERKRNLFSKVCKYIFYCICLFCFYILGKKALQLLGLIPEDIKLELSANTNNSINNSNEKMQNVELKSANMKNE